MTEETEPELETTPLQEVKDAPVPISRREIDYLLNEIYDICGLYLLVAGKSIMDVSRNPNDYLTEILDKLREYNIVE